MGEDYEPAPSHGTLRWAIQTVGIAGLFGLVAVHHFAQPDRIPPASTHVAQSGIARSVIDPETTGSIAQGARAVRLDPCGLSGGTHALRP
ncbi:hypothetical protein [Methylobacterium sp. WL120]|uniref:hypothetical protein n=1 Tax=Methylobacterium sp. WL120 TaxID=2603887 RepID=UPI0011CB1336|nr:hypothetical protein [Methylobacterium sp. WL120]TXM64935.1 hypothetical protein FV229_17035 [Methylobacterium sp. WL120]